MKRLFCLVAMLAALVGANRAIAADPKVETVAEGLTNPCGVAIQPGTGNLFVADSGALRIVRIANGKTEEVITGFTKDVYGKGPMYDISPLGIAFIDQDTLVVGGGGKPDGEEELLVFTVPKAGEKAITADKPKFSFKLPAEGDIKGEGNFYAVAVTKNAIYVSSNGDDTKGWVAKADINGTKVEGFKRFIATKEAVSVDAPVGLTIRASGDVVVGQMGEINVPEDGLLSFYNAKDGKLRANFKTGLYDITALAYSPKGQLYATDFAWMDTTKGGLYQLIAETKDGKPGMTAKKIVGLDKATSMTFDKDGNLYLTVIGTKKEGDAKPAGKLLKIAPSL